MPISCLDWEFMKKVSDYYKTTDGWMTISMTMSAMCFGNMET